MSSSLPPGQKLALEVATRTSSIFSVLGSSFIIITFVLFPYFRKSINRLVFYATFGNVLANIATLLSTSAIPRDPTKLSGLCEFQGVLIQWFLLSDSLWVLCMAINVLLVFFYGYNHKQIRNLEKWYLLTAYGIPAVPALTYVILDHTGRPTIGPATLWCWVRTDVEWMRLAFFYAPVWLFVSATMAIYIVTGLSIFRKRAVLRSFSRHTNQRPNVRFSDANADAQVNPFADLNNIVVTTQIKYDVHEHGVAPVGVSLDGDETSVSSFSSTRNLSSGNSTAAPLSTMSKSNSLHKHQNSTDTTSRSHLDGGINGSGYRAIAFAAPTTTESAPIRPGSLGPPTRAMNAAGNAAAMAYLKVSFLMFIALFVVWVPSTVNRLHQFIHKDQNFGLNVVSAVVLPLQGFWNSIIYIFTTQTECRRAWAEIVSKLTGKKVQYHPRPDTYRKDTMTSSQTTRTSDAEIAMEDFLKQGGQVRQAEMGSAGRMQEHGPYRDVR